MIKPNVVKSLRSLDIKQVLLGLLVAVAVLGVGGSMYFYQKYSALRANPNIEAQKQSAALIAALGKHILLPTDEEPSVVTISDKTKLADQPFFKMAENGDVLFAYVNTKEAILYRPSTDQIIQVASINVSAETAASQTTPAELTVAYYNGTTTAGLSAEVEKAVKESFSNLKTVSVETAAKTNYTETMVIDVSGQHVTEATQLAQLVHGVVAQLPDGEVKPNADLLIISGK